MEDQQEIICGLPNGTSNLEGHFFHLQEAQLSQIDCVMHYVSWSLVNCCTIVWKITHFV